MFQNIWKIAVIPSDGIGKETVPEGLRVLQAAQTRFDLGFELTDHDFASPDYNVAHGEMMPPDWKDRVAGCDAVLFGVVGWPELVPDHVSLWGSLIQFRREFDQHVTLWPARAMPGVPLPLAGRAPGNINPEGKCPSLFEPVHGSAPDIAGAGIANPVGQIWAAAMMLDHLGAKEAGAGIVTAIERVLSEQALRTPDLGGPADTVPCGTAIADAVLDLS